MRSKARMTITIDQDILEEISKISKEKRESRSRIIEEAIRTWRQRQMEKELIDGYLAMAKENLEMAEANLKAGMEILK